MTVGVRIVKALAVAVAFATVIGCSVPEDCEHSEELAVMVPDYSDVTVPVNVSPLNFRLEGGFKKVRAVITNSSGSRFIARGKSVRIPLRVWRKMISQAVGSELSISIFTFEEGLWTRHPDIAIHISEDEIDRYLCYRLIEPGYTNYGELALRQRDLTCFREKDIYNNSQLSQRVEQQCINCHSFQNYGTDRMQFHVRQYQGGTVIKDGYKLKKVNFKTDSLISNGVYPAWHPSLDLIAYSVNLTNQVFLRDDRQRLEVYDSASDLMLYDVENDSMQYIRDDPNCLETFPAWSSDGLRLYYASASLDSLNILEGEEFYDHFDEIRYSIYAVDFNPSARSFGDPVSIFSSASSGLSAVTPRPSPDGKFLVSAVGGYGCFHIWHNDGDLYITDLGTMETEPLAGANSDCADSFHAWSSNSRWLVFASRRDDRTYSRLYITHIDADGRASKPFVLPQKDPSHNTYFTRSYNVPEFTKEPVRTSAGRFRKVIKSNPVQASF